MAYFGQLLGQACQWSWVHCDGALGTFFSDENAITQWRHTIPLFDDVSPQLVKTHAVWLEVTVYFVSITVGFFQVIARVFQVRDRGPTQGGFFSRSLVAKSIWNFVEIIWWCLPHGYPWLPPYWMINCSSLVPGDHLGVVFWCYLQSACTFVQSM